VKRRMTRMGAVLVLVWAAIGNAPASRAQPLSAASQPASPLAFEVASVKPSKPGARGGGIRPLPGGQSYVATNVPVRLIIRLMYYLSESQLTGGPAWLNTELYDVEARAEHPSNVDQLHQMFQTLLTERFKLRFHRETRELPAFVLSVDKGSKLKLNSTPEPFEIPIKGSGRGGVVGQRVPMTYFAWFLSQQVGRPVVDRTGLDQHYDFTLQWTPEPPPSASAEAREPLPSADGPTIFTALREQLGLKLQSEKAPVEVFVIDSAERPLEN
jgi:uncharacterized protein (TIGR03435 family)